MPDFGPADPDPTKPVHFNPLLPAGGVQEPVPWDNGVCGASPHFVYETVPGRHPRAPLETVATDETTGYRQTSDRAQTTCPACLAKLAEQDGAAIVQQVANTIASTS